MAHVLQHSKPCMLKMLTRKPGMLILREALCIVSSRQASTSTLDFSGIFGPIPIPFNADESIAFDKLEENVKKSGMLFPLKITKIGTVVHKTKSLDFQILAGSAGFLFSSYAMGCVRGVCPLAYVLGPAPCSLGELFKKRDVAAAQSLQQWLIGPDTCVSKCRRQKQKL